MNTPISHGTEVRAGQRFAFGENWARFLAVLNDDRIREAERSLAGRLGTDHLAGSSFLDVGSGSGLLSLAARRLGAQVHSFDYDPQSVACTEELRARYQHGDPHWTIERGSALDDAFLRRLGSFDVVYSWGVLHHTGDMWRALANMVPLVAPGGKLFLALYNDQGGASKRWLMVKKTYNRLPALLRPVFASLVLAPLELRSFLIHLVRREPGVYFRYIRDYSQYRGMSWWHDKIDWVGGLPFEVCRPEAILDLYRPHGFELISLSTNAGGLGCNEYILERTRRIDACRP